MVMIVGDLAVDHLDATDLHNVITGCVIKPCGFRIEHNLSTHESLLFSLLFATSLCDCAGREIVGPFIFRMTGMTFNPAPIHR